MKLEYDEISPLTGQKTVVVEADEQTNIESYICMESGYTTTDKLKIDSKEVEQYESTITELMIKVRFPDKESGLVWYPAFMQMPGGMLYVKGTSFDEMQWEVTKVVPIFGDERLEYPIPGRENEYYTSKLDVENAKIFSKSEFKLAFDELYSIVKETIENEN